MRTIEPDHHRGRRRRLVDAGPASPDFSGIRSRARATVSPDSVVPSTPVDAHSVGTSRPFKAGDRVKIVGGTYKNTTGTFMRNTPQKVVVFLESIHAQRHLKPENIVPAEIRGSPPAFAKQERTRPNSRLHARNLISSGPVESSTGPAAALEQPWIPEVSDDESEQGDEGEQDAVVGSRRSPCFEQKVIGGISSMRRDCERLCAPGKVPDFELTYLAKVPALSGRLRKREFSLNSRTILEPVERTSDGGEMELIMTKIKAGSSSKWAKEVVAMYVLTKGPGLCDIDLKSELERIAGFGYLDSNKVRARLELLLSVPRLATAKKLELVKDGTLSFELTTSDVEEVPEEANEGCGFIPVPYIRRFLGDHSVGLRTCAVQVRIVAPKLGVFKGVLMTKPGISKIQLPESMRKVSPADKSESNQVFLWITKAGLFPSKNSVDAKKFLSGEKEGNTAFKINKLDRMMQQLMSERGVPKETIDKYVNESANRSKKALRHWTLVGVADPTSSIPAGHVYVTGAHDIPEIKEQVLVSRWPCTSAADGKVLSVIREKPARMSHDDWTFLRGLSFGAIVFGNPQRGECPVPCTIAGGDLDGDLYFTCWSEDILSHESGRQVPRITRSEVVNAKKDFRENAWNENWLEDAQKHISDIQALSNLHGMISQLYTLWEKGSGEDKNHFGEALKEAIDTGKHGGAVQLPQHLWHKLRPNYRPLLCDRRS